MKDSHKLLLLGTIIFLFGMLFVTILRDWPRLTGQIKTGVSPTPPTPTVENKQAEHADWSLFRNGYALPLPPKWKNTSDTGGVAVLEPGEMIGSLEEISIMIVSDKKAPQGQQFTTQRELDEWSAVSGQVQGDIQKTKNIFVDGNPGVMLVDVTGETNKWVAMAWTRKENVNVQIRFTGRGTYTDKDMETVDYIVTHFTFTAPPMSGKEEKE